jgi:hypothetical protein
MLRIKLEGELKQERNIRDIGMFSLRLIRRNYGPGYYDNSYAYDNGYGGGYDNGHAAQNGFVCQPGTVFRGEDGRRYLCQ